MNAMRNDNNKSRQYERESFAPTIDELKRNANFSNIIITDADIATKLKISLGEFAGYYENDNAPAEIFTLLRENYGEFMKRTFMKYTLYDEVEEQDDDEIE